MTGHNRLVIIGFRDLCPPSIYTEALSENSIPHPQSETKTTITEFCFIYETSRPLAALSRHTIFES